jgi:co-chaperonin GroES (HSP10)
MPYMVMQHDEDPAESLKGMVGDLNHIEVFNNQVLVAVYIRPNKTKSGIYLSDKTTDEDRYQSKVGLVLKKGPTAFVDETQNWFKGVNVDVGDWIIFRPSDGWAITVNNVLCRMLDDTAVRGCISRPDLVW